MRTSVRCVICQVQIECDGRGASVALTYDTADWRARCTDLLADSPALCGNLLARLGLPPRDAPAGNDPNADGQSRR